MRAIGIGAGGHAKVLLESLQARGDVEVVGLLDSDKKLHGTSVLGVKVLGGDELLPKLRRDGVMPFGNCHLRFCHLDLRSCSRELCILQ